MAEAGDGDGVRYGVAADVLRAWGGDKGGAALLRWERVIGFDPCGGFLGGGEAAFELSVLDFCEDDGHAGAAGVAHGEEVAAGEEPGG